MLIWKGHGILILVFGVIGGLALGMLTAGAYAATHWGWVGRLIIAANFWGAAGAIWFYAKTMGKPVEKTYLDPATHSPVVIRSSHSLFFIPPVPWAILATLVACLMTVVSFMMPSENFLDGASSSASSAEKTAFDRANSLITSDKGKEAYGNTPEAEKLAAAFASMVKLGRQMGVQKGKKSAISLSHGKFLTYCRINADSCAFMVHVPDLRKFSEDAKEYMAEIAWAVATESAAQLKPQPKRLAVGIRGVFLYDTVLEGHIVADENDSEEGIEQRHTGGSPQKYLEAFFVDSKAVNAVLPKSEPEDEPEEKITTTMPQPVTSGGEATKPARSSSQKLDVLLKWIPSIKPGEVAGNADSVNQIVLKYAGFVHDRVAVNPALGGMTLPEPCFSAYIHLRDDTAAFFLTLPAGSDLTPDVVKLIQREAWGMAVVASAQMSPMPERIAVVTYNEGQMDLTRIGALGKKDGTGWLVEQELTGEEGRDVLAPFMENFSKPMITVKSPLTMATSVKPMLPATASEQPAPAAPAMAASSAPLLPTPVRDWKDGTGRVMQASLERFTSPACDTGYFKRADGQGFEVPVARLSADDQEFIREIAEKSKAAPQQ